MPAHVNSSRVTSFLPANRKCCDRVSMGQLTTSSQSTRSSGATQHQFNRSLKITDEFKWHWNWTQVFFLVQRLHWRWIECVNINVKFGVCTRKDGRFVLMCTLKVTLHVQHLYSIAGTRTKQNCDRRYWPEKDI